MNADRITVNYASYQGTATALFKAGAVADANIAELQSNNTANLNAGNWEGVDQLSYQSVHEVVLQANENLANAIRKTSSDIQLAEQIHQSGQVQAAGLYT